MGATVLFFCNRLILFLIVNLKISNYVDVLLLYSCLLIAVYFIILCVVCKETNKTSNVLQDENATLQLKNLNFKWHDGLLLWIIHHAVWKSFEVCWTQIFVFLMKILYKHALKSSYTILLLSFSHYSCLNTLKFFKVTLYEWVKT